jgi:hypothetical protein
VNDSLRPLLEGQFLERLAIDLAAVVLLVRGVYFSRYRRTDLFLTFFAFNLAIFLVTFVLNRVELSLGAAFGLFAVFSMLRYRTEGISTTDMTYLFLVVGLGLVMGVPGTSVAVLSVVSAVLVGGTRLFESSWLGRRESVQEIWYDRIELVHISRRAELTEDLRKRTGLDVHRVDVRQMDLIRDAALLGVYYRD